MASTSSLGPSIMNETFFTQSPADDEHLLRCWAIQDCKGCLRQPDCSWCPFSWTCVPNNHPVQFLAPAWEGDTTCPHWAERWEIRTRPLGCQVSTITTLTSLVTVACTLSFVFLLWLAGVAARRLVAFNSKHPGWWRVWRLDGARRQLRIFGIHMEQYQEREPLLPSTRGTDPP
ncbi:hypothetical protein GGR51DRAFT_297231 [Nemania sp. FL0031]|nr:hypothetical protein GGR51DRAFT_297231 [Nemania sp. FL0031]